MCIDSSDTQPIHRSTAVDVRTSSDAYLKALRAEHVSEALSYWKSGEFGQSKTEATLRRLREDIGFADGHLSTDFRRAFSVSEANGQAGYFVVVEYGTRTKSKDLIQYVVWAVDDMRWQIVCHGYIFRCGPDSTPIDLSSSD